MAIGYTPSQMDPSAGGGGSNWERNMQDRNARDVSTATPQYDRFGNPIGFGWRESDGRITLINGDRYSSYGGSMNVGDDKSFVRDAVNQTERDLFNGPGGNGGGNGGGLPMGLKALAAVPAIARQLGGGNGSGNGNASMPPELQQLLAMAMQRMSQQEPLFQSINAQAMAGLPTAYQR